MRLSINDDLALPLLAATLTAALLLAGCGSGGTGERPPATEIIRVDVDPNPVAAGDTTVLTCIVADSTDSSLEFDWLPPKGGFVETDTNQYRWEAPNRADTLGFTVLVERPGDASVRSTQESFDVVVIDDS